MKANILTLAILIVSLTFSCRGEIEEIVEETLNTGDSATTETVDYSNYPDWSESTHSNQANLNYDVVFNQNEVLRFDIEIDSDDWNEMQEDLSSILGSGNSGPGFGPMAPPPMGGGGGTSTVDEDPMWIPCTLKFNDTDWYEVGIRYKGNSSLQSAYRSGNNKLSFKLDFDEFEDDYPALKNQRFYGFKQLNLNNNFDDSSLLREKVGADLFRQFGLASAQTTFCTVYINTGNGPQYYGVYTLVEEVDDTVIKTQFSSNSGNLYKPDGTAASFASGTYNTSELELKTNTENPDYSDAELFYEALNSSTRTSDINSWKNALESTFDVDNFLKWLAANTVIQNWDTYGIMTHNYYLYNNPETQLLTWIPWDNNEAFQEGKQGGALSLSFTEVGSNWPIIRYIINQPEYEEQYEAYLQQFIDEVFVPESMNQIYSNYYNLLKEHAYKEESEYTFIYSDNQFDQAIETLKAHAQSRSDAVNGYLK